MSTWLAELALAVIVAVTVWCLTHRVELPWRRPELGSGGRGRESAPSPARLPAPSTPAPNGAQAARVGGARIVLRRPHATQHPILLAHGWFGFDRIGLPRFEHEYFRGVPKRLSGLGHRVHVARVSPTGSVRMRAAQLARQIEQLGHARVNIIAHSMGGLDARLAIARHGIGERVASLTTIGTPHHGTPLADMAADFGEWRSLRRLLSAAGADVDGLYDISTTSMREFNQYVTDSPAVAYTSVVGVVDANAPALNALLSLGHRYLLSRSGPNDGLVPAWSQRWGDTVLEVDADHWAQVGWFGRFDALAFYAQLAELLAGRGF